MTLRNLTNEDTLAEADKLKSLATYEILITNIEGTLQCADDFSSAMLYENTNITITGTLDIPDQSFALPIRRNDDRLFIFLAEVIDGAFSVVVNFPTSGAFTYSEVEANKDLPYKMFKVKPINLDVVRKITDE